MRRFLIQKYAVFFVLQIRFKKRERNRPKNGLKKGPYFSLFFAPKIVGFYQCFFIVKLRYILSAILTSNNRSNLRSKIWVKFRSFLRCFFVPVFFSLFEVEFEVRFGAYFWGLVSSFGTHHRPEISGKKKLIRRWRKKIRRFFRRFSISAKKAPRIYIRHRHHQIGERETNIL